MNWFKTMQYLVAGEESRPGIQDRWRDVFLAARTPLQRRCLEFTKTMVIVAVCFSAMALLFPA